ncbi:MAG: proton-conducting transporter membrane subunit [Bacillota bacterium]
MEAVLDGLVLPGGIGLRADGLSLVLAGVSALVWLAAALASVDYVGLDDGSRRYYVCYLFTLTGVLGTFLAADFLTLLLFFEFMTLSSYFLVVHTRTTESVAAGNLYLYLSLAGGLVLLVGVALLNYLGGGLALDVLLDAGVLSTATVVLMVVGFSVKSALVPMHVWLPLAHPVAPAPASAVLSGVMIKTGAYGVLRSLLVLSDTPASQQLGLALILMAGVSMLVGVIMALLQSDAKRMLAYHSVSQMGYILMGVGLVAYLGPEDPLAFAGSLYHIVNHALFKSALFLVVGAVYLRTHETDMYKLGGLWRQMPAIALVGLVAAMGIAGVPGLNGYVSKTVLHHALEHAAHGRPLLTAVEWAFIITGAGTACSFLKFFGFIFLGRPRTRLQPGREGMATVVGTVLLAAAIVVLGLQPAPFLHEVVAPAFSGLTGATFSAHLSVFAVEDLKGIATCLGLGLALFAVGVKTGLFHVHPPAWLSVGWLASATARGVGRAVNNSATVLSSLGDRLWTEVLRLNHALVSEMRQMDGPSFGTHHANRANLANLSFDAAIVMAVLAAILISRAVLGGHLGAHFR